MRNAREPTVAHKRDQFHSAKSKEITMVRKTVPSVLEAIGNTPMVQLKKVVPPSSADVFVKLEYYNPTGSYKDRMALSVIEEAEKRGDLRSGMTVVEYTGGSTGSSLAFVCAVKGYRLHVVSSDAFAKEKLQTMRAFGAELTLVPSQGGKVTPDLTPRMMQHAREIAESEPSYFTDQLHNADAAKGYEQIGQELVEQVGGPIHAFCASVGTAHMLMGVAHVLRRLNPSPRVVALEPASSPILSRGISGTHHVEGIGIGFVPPLLDKAFYDEARGIDEVEARKMAWRLAREEGIFAGTSSGMNVLGACELARELGPAHTVVTVAVDTGLKYLAGDLFSQETP
jgi:cysteine synthase